MTTSNKNQGTQNKSKTSSIYYQRNVQQLAVGIQNLRHVTNVYFHLDDEYEKRAMTGKHIGFYTSDEQALAFRLMYTANELLEILFKLLSFVTIKQFEKGHNILDLYRALSDETKAILDKIFLDSKSNQISFTGRRFDGEIHSSEIKIMDFEGFLDMWQRFQPETSRYWFAVLYQDPNNKSTVWSFVNPKVFKVLVENLLKYFYYSIEMDVRTETGDVVSTPLEFIPNVVDLFEAIGRRRLEVK